MIETVKDRSTAKVRLAATWERTDRIFEILAKDAWLAQPIALRHPFIFYLGHLPAFALHAGGFAAAELVLLEVGQLRPHDDLVVVLRHVEVPHRHGPGAIVKVFWRQGLGSSRQATPDVVLEPGLLRALVGVYVHLVAHVLVSCKWNATRDALMRLCGVARRLPSVQHGSREEDRR